MARMKRLLRPALKDPSLRPAKPCGAFDSAVSQLRAFVRENIGADRRCSPAGGHGTRTEWDADEQRLLVHVSMSACTITNDTLVSITGGSATFRIDLDGDIVAQVEAINEAVEQAKANFQRTRNGHTRRTR